MSKEDIFKKLKEWLNKISPPLPVGGMHITDFGIRYAGAKGGKFIRESMRLQPGIVEDGRIKNKDALSTALTELRRRASPNLKKSISVILSLPIRDVYIQTFSTPQVAEDGFEEAAELNAKMISPINAENAYYGWQRVSEGFSASVDVSMLGAFVQKSIADEFVEALESAGFGIAAIEFESMSLARSVNRAKLVEGEKPYVIIKVAVEGLSLVVVRKGIPHFHYFHSWSEIQGDGKAISIDNLMNAIADELERIINFYLTHWKEEPMNDVVVVTSAFGEEISKLMEDEFSNLNMQIIDPTKISVVVGAAWRGTVTRSTDTEISLASLSALDVFERQQFKNFVRIWRNMLVASLGFLLLLFVSANIFLRSEMTKILEDRRSIASSPSAEEFLSLSEKAEEFNSLVAMIGGIENSGIEVTPFVIEVFDIAGENINITRLNLGSSKSTVLLNGTAPDEGAAVEFKNRLAEKTQFYEVNLPLQNISQVGGNVSFNLTFKINSFDFSEDISEEASEETEQPEAESPVDEVSGEEVVEPSNGEDLGGELQNISEELNSGGTEPSIIFGKLNFISSDDPVYLDISAVDTEAALLFRDLLEESSAFYAVEIISDIIDSANRVDFTIKFLIGP